MSQNGKGSKRRPGKPGTYEEGWDRVFGKKTRKWMVLTENSNQMIQLSDKECAALNKIFKTKRNPYV